MHVDIIREGIIVVILIRAVYTDVIYGKIENRLIAIGYGLAFVLAYLRGGGKEILQCGKMSIIVLAALFFLYVIKGLGAGDIKLLSMLAAFTPTQIMNVVILSFFLGATIAIANMVGRWICKEPFYIPGETIKFSIPIMISTIFCTVVEIGF